MSTIRSFIGMWLFLCVSVSAVAFGQLSDPFMVLIDNRDWRDDRSVEVSELIAESMPEGSAPFPTMEQLGKRKRPYGFNRTDPRIVTGRAYCLNHAGRVVRYRFRTMPKEESFHELMKREVQRRGDSTIAGGTNLKIHLSNPAGVRDPSLDRSVPVISWRDSWWAWDDGVLLWGGPHVHSVSTASLADHIRRGRGRDWYGYVAPSAVSEKLREEYLRQFVARVSVRMQQTDSETDASHAIRKAFGQNVIDVSRSLLTDIESVVASVRYPGKTKTPFKAHVALNVKPRSVLAGLIAEFHSSRSMPALTPDSVAAVRASLTVPDMFRPGLAALVGNSRFVGTKIGDSLLRLISEGKLRCSARLYVKDETVMLSAASTGAVGSIDSTVLSVAFGGSVNESGDAVIPFSLPFFLDTLSSQEMAVRVREDEVRLVLPINSSEPTIADDTVTLHPGTAVSALVLVDAEFRTWAADSDDSPSRQFLRQLERMYQHWNVYQYPVGYRRSFMGSVAPQVPVVSLSEKLRPEGDNRLQGRLFAEHNGTSLHADCTIGRDLFGWLLARKLVSGLSVHKASVFGGAQFNRVK